jgi:hypothetical protein
MKSVHGLREHNRGRVLEMAESSLDNENKIAELSGGQKELEPVVPTPSGVPSPETKVAARSEPIEFEPLH